MDETFNWVLFIGGLAFFFIGLTQARDGLQLSAGDRLRRVLGHLVGNRFKALFAGSLITVILQSSSATSVMLVSFASASLISLKSAIAVLLGSDIGTTFVVVLLSIKKITDYSLLIVAVGFFFSAVLTNRRLKYLSLVVLGFGMIFYGMQMMSDAAIPLKNSETASKVFLFLSTEPFWLLIISTIFTAIIQTSAATIGLAIALAFANVIGFREAVPIVLGANIGTCMTAIIACFGSKPAGKRVAIAHTLSKIIAVAMVFPFLNDAIEFIDKLNFGVVRDVLHLQRGVAGKIAIFHLAFNIFVALLFLPLIPLLEKIVYWILPQKKEETDKFQPKYLDDGALATPSIAFAHAKMEIMRIAKLTRELLEKSLLMFSKGEDHEKWIDRVEEEDDKIDILEKAVRFYLANISANMDQTQAATQLSLVNISSDLEEIGDVISINMISLAKRKAKWHRIFSKDGWDDLRGYLKKVEKNFEFVVMMLSHPSKELLEIINNNDAMLDDELQTLRQAHLKRLHDGLQETLDTSSIHLEILANLRRINTKLTQIAKKAPSF